MAQSSSAVAFVQMAPLSQQPSAFLQSAVPAASPPGGAWEAAVPQTQSASAAGSSSTVVLAAAGLLAAAVVSGGSRGERRGARRANVVARRFFGGEPAAAAVPQTQSASAAGSSSTVVLAAAGLLAAAVVSGGSRGERRGARRANVVARRLFGGEPAAEAKFDPAVQLGAMEPLGYFDPLSLSKVGEEDEFRKFRAAEIKHGRVCMIASLGLVGQHFAGTGGVVKGTLGTLLSESGAVGIAGILAVSAFLEFTFPENPDKEPGNFGDPLGVDQYTQEMREKELNNGRMAMMAVAGILGAELATGEDAIQQFGLPGSG
ncbi:unnamed protein product [Polarella glacialis]|uniref:Uncharacterized protein n=1 Tax=Polarella glacialis TaxID=89957 RepID=A0A813DVR7_POLGL|nr:unnamed protein product [Polarella glacialis]